MLLDRIDIDAHGPLHRVELGPLAEGLNVVWGPDGAGKTAIVRFLRDSLVSRDYPLGMMSSSTGRVVWADRYGLVHCRREQDGTPGGRRTIEFESRGEYPLRFDALDHSWISGAAATTEATLALNSIRLPEPVVDGVITDTALTSVARVVSACLHAGLDSLSPDHSLQSAGHHSAVSADPASAAPAPAQSPLAEAASRWLNRLSAGRLQRVDWGFLPPQSPGDDHRSNGQAGHAVVSPAPSPAHSGSPIAAQIDRRGEDSRDTVDRVLAVMAIRLAAAETVGKSGRSLPLVFEMDDRCWQQILRMTPADAVDPGHAAPPPHGDHRPHPPVVATLQQCAAAGNQVLVLTASGALADAMSRAGSRTFRLHPRRIVHAHRPLWQPQYAAEHYVGPHPHTYGPHTHNGPATIDGTATIDAINRDFDAAWREAYGMHQPATAMPASGLAATDAANGDTSFRDGYYFAESYTTADPAAAAARTLPPEGNWPLDARHGHAVPSDQATPGHAPGLPAGSLSSGLADAAGSIPETPFFLSVDSPIDQAPSIDAVAAARLRGLGITHITHLMQQDANRLADTLGLANVNAASVRRWRHECRLVCNVPQLRGFDARLLVGCGITDPAQLAATHPSDLLDRVEAFLATERGQRILLSGTSYELARITSWMAAAGRAEQARAEQGQDDAVVLDGRRDRAGRQRPEDSEIRYGDEYETADDEHHARQDRRRRTTESLDTRRPTRGERSGRGAAEHRSHPRRRSSGGGRDVVRFQRSNDPVQRKSSAGGSPARGAKRSGATSDEDDHGELEMQFYLGRSSDLVDAPSIGPRMAERLAAVGMETVDDLLSCDPETVAAELDHRRVDAETVAQWQQQAELVCRIPMLRGHDAQLLIAAGINTPEELASRDAEQLHEEIDPIARSREGKRILRGGRLPDLDEVAEWIAWAGHHRQLMAA